MGMRSLNSARIARWTSLLGLTATLQGAAAFAGGWSAPVTLSAPDFSVIQLDAVIATAPSGLATAVWSQANDGTIQTATETSTGVWGNTVNLSHYGNATYAAHLAIGRDGTACAIWLDITDAGTRYAKTWIKSATRPAGATTWGTFETVAGPDPSMGYPQVGVDGRGNVLAIWLQTNGSHIVVRTATRNGGAWSAATTISDASFHAMLPSLAMSPFGWAVAVWQVADSGYTPFVVQAATRTPANVWGAPLELSTPTVNTWNAQVAIDMYGRATAAWFRNGMIETTRMVRVGGRWEPPTVVSPPGSTVSWPSVAVTLTGDAIVGWQGQASPTALHAAMAAIRPAHAFQWTVATLSNTSYASGEDVGPPKVAAAADGSVLVVSWEDNTQLVARAATFPATTHKWTKPITIGSDGLWDNPVVVTAGPGGPGGTAHVLWAHGISHYSTEMQAATFTP